MDARGYSVRSDVDQQEVQRGILAVCDRAARAAGLQRESWIRQGTGDGELAILPSDEPEEVVVDHYVREIDAELRRYNGRLRPMARIRLRVAVHFGRLSRASNGHAGPAPIAVARLIDSAVLRAALTEAPAANLALLVSAPVFDDTVASLATTLRPSDFQRVRVEEKEFTEDAWLWVPGHDMHTEHRSAVAGQGKAPEPQAEPRSDDGPRGATHVVHNTFSDRVSASGSVFGMQFGADR